MLKVDIKSKIYKMKNQDFVALQDIKFELGDKGIVCILGPSGSGKTTLMNIIGGLDSDFEGDVVINSKSLKSFKTSELDSYRKDTIGFIFQQFYLINKFTSYDNVAVALDLSNSKQKDEKIKNLLKSVEMESYAKRKVNLLSGGQKQRVAIARALANSPDIILADEPTGALDSKTTEEVMQVLKDLSKNKLVVIITHSDELVKEYADRVIRIEDGKLVENEDNVGENKATANDTDSSSNAKVKRSKMSVFNAFKHSFKSIMNRKGRLIATSIGMSIGIIGIGLALALSNGTMDFAKSQIESIMPTNMVTISFKDDKNANTSISFNGNTTKNTFKTSDFNDMKKLDNSIKTFWPVPKFAMTGFFTEVSLSEDDAKSDKVEDTSFVTQNGFEPAENINNAITYGRNAKSDDEAVISLNTAEYLTGNKDNNLSDLLGKNLYVKFQEMNKKSEDKVYSFKIVGITNINTMGYSMYQNSEDTLNLYEKINGTKKYDMEFLRLYAYLDSGLSSSQITNNINNFNNSQSKYKMEGAADTMLSSVQTFMDIVRNVLIGFSSISIVIAVLMIGIVTFISVIERITEIGILRAIGARKADIRRIFLFETVIVGLFSGLIGVAITNLISKVINSGISGLMKGYGMNMGNVNIANLSSTNALELIALCIILSVIAGVIPANKAAKLDPIVALRRN